MAWINLDQNYLEHPKTKRLRKEFGRSSEMVPIRLWLHCSKYHEKDGILNGYKVSELKLICDWCGNMPSLLSGLVAIGFLDDLGEGNYKVHDWEETQGHIVAFKERGKKANEIRWGKYREAQNERKQSGGPRGVNATPL